MQCHNNLRLNCRQSLSASVTDKYGTVCMIHTNLFRARASFCSKPTSYARVRLVGKGA